MGLFGRESLAGLSGRIVSKSRVSVVIGEGGIVAIFGRRSASPPSPAIAHEDAELRPRPHLVARASTPLPLGLCETFFVAKILVTAS